MNTLGRLNDFLPIAVMYTMLESHTIFNNLKLKSRNNKNFRFVADQDQNVCIR